MHLYTLPYVCYAGGMTCGVCERPHYAHGLCKSHYDKMRRRGTTERWVPTTRHCTIAGCDRPHYARGLCTLHYQRLAATGSTNSPRPDARTKFMAKAAVRADGCWEWTGARTNGYGRLHVNGRNVAAHRYSYEIHVGPIPRGLHVDHICRRPWCVNPEHLEPVTQTENNRRTAGFAHRYPRP